MLLAAVVVTPPQLPPRVIKMPLTIHVPAPRLAAPPKDAGGGQSTPGPTKRGRPPVTKPRRLFLPPMVARNEASKLVLASAVIDPPDLTLAIDEIGDPLGLSKIGAGGIGSGRGIGTGTGDGIGDGSQSGLGSKVVASVKKLTRKPEVLHKVEPEYSEEARRARLQGFVRLAIDVGLDGIATNIRVVKSMGFGLDESAIDAVKRWRFRPALMGDDPVIAPAVIEVGFHLI